MDTFNEDALLKEKVHDLKVWKKSLGLKKTLRKKIWLKYCIKYAQGRCNLTEVGSRDYNLAVPNLSYRSIVHSFIPKMELKSLMIK